MLLPEPQGEWGRRRSDGREREARKWVLTDQQSLNLLGDLLERNASRRADTSLDHVHVDGACHWVCGGLLHGHLHHPSLLLIPHLFA